MAESSGGKHVPRRMCVSCGRRDDQTSLLRLVRTSKCGVVPQERDRLYGRSAYVCFELACVDRARKRKSVERALRTVVPESVWLSVRRAVEQGKETPGESSYASPQSR